MPARLIPAVKEENYQFTLEQHSFQVEKIVKRVLDRVIERQETLSKVFGIAQQNPGGCQAELVNFNLYLMSVVREPRIQKWLILNQCFKEFH